MLLPMAYFKGWIDGRAVRASRDTNGMITSPFVQRRLERIRHYRFHLERSLYTKGTRELIQEAQRIIVTTPTEQGDSPRAKAFYASYRRHAIERLTAICLKLHQAQREAQNRYLTECNRIVDVLFSYYSGMTRHNLNINPKSHSDPLARDPSLQRLPVLGELEAFTMYLTSIGHAPAYTQLCVKEVRSCLS